MRLPGLIRTTLVGLALFSTAGPAFAAGDCANAENEAALNQCAGKSLKASDGELNTLYKQIFNYEPAYQSAESTACGVAYVKAIEKAGSIDPEKVRDEIAKLNFTSFYGQIKFDERGINVTKPMAVEQWQNGKRVTVWPADVAEGKATWPFPAWTAR